MTGCSLPLQDLKDFRTLRQKGLWPIPPNPGRKLNEPLLLWAETVIHKNQNHSVQRQFLLNCCSASKQIFNNTTVTCGVPQDSVLGPVLFIHAFSW
ncbi:hypothetical protein ILYODFUR_027303 [Ilyodon furcidens]|uniref:Reverse transcriptase n=1 Tax=Ilyodon furcidens TaxID=33524 RepID=A0ABV0UVK9_9TELE